MSGDWGLVEYAMTVQLLRNTPVRRLEGLMMNMVVNWKANSCDKNI